MDKLTDQQFLQCVAEHQMIVLLDNGVYRHIRFKAPNTNNQYFDLVTYPGFLVFSGDMGSYVFSRVNDMFNFFAGSGINPGYWAEKLEAIDRSNGYNGFSAEKFGELISAECEDQLHDLLASGEVDEDDAQEVREELEDASAGYIMNACRIGYNQTLHTIEYGLKHSLFVRVNADFVMLSGGKL